MNRDYVEGLAKQLLAGEVSIESFVASLSDGVSVPLGEVTLDIDRQRRCGFPEVVYGEGKSTEVLASIFQRLLEENLHVLATRIDKGKAAALISQFPQCMYNDVARTLRIVNDSPSAAPSRLDRALVAVVTAGTSDLPVAEEARETLDWMGVPVRMIHDVGVAGPHRLPPYIDELRTCDAVVVAAGLEGALPSVVGGYVDSPVVAVPTSVGYGASLQGFAALLGMLNSCASNVSVVNIDAGFKAGYVAGLIATRIHQHANP